MRKKKFTRNIGILLSEQDYFELVKITDELEVTISEYFRELLKREFKNNLKEKK